MTERSPPRLVERPAEAQDGLGDAPFKLANSLPDHPLFQPRRLRRLLETLPRPLIEIRKVEISNSQTGDYKRGPKIPDADPVRSFEELDEKPLWMLLHDTWKHDEEYAALMREYVASLAESFGELRAPLSDIGCWIFLSAGKSVVHFHADPDQSFLNQIRGGKTVYVYPSSILPEDTVEKLVYSGNQGFVTYDPAYEPRMFEPVHLAPGESVFLPLYAPHRVTNDDSVCISWNVGFNTRHSRRRNAVHRANFELRHLGFSPSPFGHRPLVDSIKSRSLLAFRVKNRIFKRLRPQLDVSKTYGA